MECSAAWINSTTVDEISVRKSGAFTTLPVRISKYNEIAITTAQKLACIWDTMRCGSVSSRPINVGRNLLPLVVPEALPERTATAVKLIELGHLCDVFSDQLDSQSRAEVYSMLTRCLDRCSVASSCSCPSTCNKEFGDRQAQLRTLIYEVATEAIQFDREQGMLILELLGKAVAPEPMSFGCRKSSAFRTFWPILEFAIGMKLSEMDRILLRDIKNVVDECHMLNDEYWGANATSSGVYQTDFGRMPSLSFEGGKESLKSRIIDLEYRYRALQAEVCGKYPVESMRLRRWIEAAGVAMAGYNYWRALSANGPCNNLSTSACSCSPSEWTRVTTPASTISYSSSHTYSGTYDRGESTTLTAVTNYINTMPPSSSI